MNPVDTPRDPWMEHMRRGDFAAAWAISDAALRARAGRPCWHWPRHQQYVWDGTPLAGRRVLVRCYHGLGDTVQFIRYVPRVKAVAREVIVWAQPALLPLLGSVPGIDRLLPLHDGAPEAEYDVDVEVMELPHVFRTTLATLPAEVPYLRSVPIAWPRTGHLRVGLVWQAGEWDPRRSIPPRTLAPLLACPGVQFLLLQRGARLPAELGLPHVHDRSSPQAEMVAATMTSLDLMISVDSFPAHLAGALGVPTWLLLAHEADWRWMAKRDDSPWYPTLRLFRQPSPDEWAPVIVRVCRELAALAAEHVRKFSHEARGVSAQAPCARI